MKIKVLQLKAFKLCRNLPRHIESFKNEETIVIFNRDGIYKMGDKCWFEKNGKAYLFDINKFDREMERLNAMEICIQVIKALNHVRQLDPRILTKNQKELLDRRYEAEQVKMVGLRAKALRKKTVSKSN